MSWRFRAQDTAACDPWNLARCEACGRCSAACPVAEAMDFTPAQVVAMALDGQDDRLTRLSTPWVCTDCRACDDVCPQGVRVAGFLGHLRQDCSVEQRHEDVPVDVEMVSGWHRAFRATCSATGRVGQWGTALRYRWITFDVFTNLALEAQWLLTGRYRVLPRWPSRAIRRLFDRVRRRRQELLEAREREACPEPPDGDATQHEEPPPTVPAPTGNGQPSAGPDLPADGPAQTAPSEDAPAASCPETADIGSGEGRED